MIRRPPRSTRVRSSAASDVYKRQELLSAACTTAPENHRTMRNDQVAQFADTADDQSLAQSRVRQSLCVVARRHGISFARLGFRGVARGYECVRREAEAGFQQISDAQQEGSRGLSGERRLRSRRRRQVSAMTRARGRRMKYCNQLTTEIED